MANILAFDGASPATSSFSAEEQPVAGPSSGSMPRGNMDIRFLDCLNTDFTHLLRFSIAANQMVRLLKTEDARSIEEIQVKLVENLEVAKETLSEAGASPRPFIPCPAHLAEYRQAYYDMLHAAQPLVPHIQDVAVQIRLRRLLLPLTSTSHFRFGLANKSNHSLKKPLSPITTWWDSQRKSLKGRFGLRTTSKLSVLGPSSRRLFRRQNALVKVRRSAEKSASQGRLESGVQQKRCSDSEVTGKALPFGETDINSAPQLPEHHMDGIISERDDSLLSSDEEKRVHSSEESSRAYCGTSHVEEGGIINNEAEVEAETLSTASSLPESAEKSAENSGGQEEGTKETEKKEDENEWKLTYNWADSGEEPCLPKGYTWATSWPTGPETEKDSVFAPGGILGPNFFEQVRQAQLQAQLHQQQEAEKQSTDTCSVM